MLGNGRGCLRVRLILGRCLRIGLVELFVRFGLGLGFELGLGLGLGLGLELVFGLGLRFGLGLGLRSWKLGFDSDVPRGRVGETSHCKSYKININP